jgi:hypothetical protein
LHLAGGVAVLTTNELGRSARLLERKTAGGYRRRGRESSEGACYPKLIGGRMSRPTSVGCLLARCEVVVDIFVFRRWAQTFAGRHAVGKHDPIQMVDFMLEDACQPAGRVK